MAKEKKNKQKKQKKKKKSMSEAVFHLSLRRLGMPEAKLDF